MPFLLRMREASFGLGGAAVGPLTLDVLPGERAVRVFGDAREAKIAALLAAGIVKASAGSVLIDQFDPRVQSAHCKRIAAFVPNAPLPFAEPSEFERYVGYRAALWGIDAIRAVTHAKILVERLAGVHEAFVYPLAAALVAGPKLIVLDRPQPAYAAQIVAAIGPRAIFSTHLSESAARAFMQEVRTQART